MRDYRIITLNYLLLPFSQWNQDTREKVETFENYLFVVAKEMHYAHYSNHLVVVNINIIVFSNWVITIHPSDIECVEQVIYYSMIICCISGEIILMMKKLYQTNQDGSK